MYDNTYMNDRRNSSHVSFLLCYLCKVVVVVMVVVVVVVLVAIGSVLATLPYEYSIRMLI